MEAQFMEQLRVLTAAVPSLEHFTFILPHDLSAADAQHFHEIVHERYPHFQSSPKVIRPGGVEIDLTHRCPDGGGLSPIVRLGILSIAGRYQKYSRRLSQSPWMLPDGTRNGDTSLQEILADPILRLCFPNAAPGKRRRCLTEVDERTHRTNRSDRETDWDVYKFVTAGREDIDVRMLGNGRPFLLNITGATRVPTQDELDHIADRLEADPDGPVGVTGLKVVPPSVASQKLLEGEEKKRKTYRAVVWLERSIRGTDSDVLAVNAIHDLSIKQITPMRVLHRRTLMTRDKTIHSCTLTVVNAHWGTLDLVTSAGTYVKEWVFGDHGRTTPSLGDLLHTRCDIIQLDVVKIDMEW